MLDCGVSSPTRLAIIWSTLMPEWMMAPFEMCAPDKQTAGLGGMNALARERLDVETVDHVDLLFEGFEGGEGLARASWTAPWPSALQ